MSVSQLVTEARVKEILETVDYFLFDCDGVLWDGNGVIEGSVETIKKLKSLGKKVYYVTNNSSKSRQDYLEKCKECGFPAELDDIVCTAYAAAQYLKNIGFKNKVYLVGKDESMGTELKDAGIQYFGPGPDLLNGASYEEWFKNTVLDSEVKCVVVGFDPHISYMKIMKAASYLRNPDCIFIGTNEDRSLPAKDKDIVIPGTGCMVLPVALAANRRPILMGKPETNMFDLLKKVRNIDPSRCLMTGDSISTDIVFAKNCGVRSMLVLSGMSTEDDLITANGKGSNADPKKQPDVYAQKLSEFGKFI
ncbi:glycerol-3-phosphate phosphatase-like isoform X1 [Biomphalaria glabrata]|uniref:Glycerol-3-phosphate phosphatase-like isoform X1 n=1 Tax=Biomphalaria glabrata TaxID=6526 RepID=A0A9U8DV86_BIOGL|nr:glycerol-3-phosphate phosphatase-like isoform X1 [Biomphalaria glabrata]